MRSKCKLQSILSIFNVTKDDEGNYSCYWDCNNRVAAIHLATFIQSRTGIGRFKKDTAEISFFSSKPLPTLTLNPDLTIDHAHHFAGHLAKCLLDSNNLVHTLNAYSIAAKMRHLQNILGNSEVSGQDFQTVFEYHCAVSFGHISQITWYLANNHDFFSKFNANAQKEG